MTQKNFYYTGKTYQNATYTETYRRISRHIRIDYNLNGDPYFRHGGKRYKIADFMRVNYPSCAPLEVIAQDGERVELHAYEAKNYYKPLFIELDDAGETVRVYRYEGSTTDYTV